MSAFFTKEFSMKILSALVLAALSLSTAASANSFNGERFERRDRNRHQCNGERYEWNQVGRSYVCYLTELRWAPRLATCEWNRVQPVSDHYCR